MNIDFYVPPIKTGENEWDRDVTVTWPADWPVPREGDVVYVHDRPLWVSSVQWYPEGEDDPVPFVHVSLSNRNVS